jgi:hypothetical protein
MNEVESYQPTDDPCADAIDFMWKNILLKYKPDYGDWEYPGFAARHIIAEFEDLRNELAAYKKAVEHLNTITSEEYALNEFEKLQKELEHERNDQ